MATITVPAPGADGTTTVAHVAATAGGDTLATGGRSVGLLVRNTGAADRTVTLGGVDECSQGQVHDEPYLAPAGVEMVLPVPLHCMDAAGDVAVSYDDAAGLEVAAVRLPSVGLSPTVVRNGIMVFDNGDGTLTIVAVRPGAMTNNGDGTLTLTSLSGAVPHANGTLTLATV